MCGINGILRLDAQRQADEQTVVQMRDALEHRGPDDKGIFMEGAIGLGHRRLAILDVSPAGHQPFLSEDGRYVMVYNGEIYNYKDFYAELKSRGHTIRTGSDTEVLMKLFELYGTAMLKRLNGMFAFAVWDREDRKLTLARDRFGVKPLYYSFFDNSLFFGSEEKALFAGGVPMRLDEDGLEEYIFNRFVAGKNTLYRDLYNLLPGHILEIPANGKPRFEKWWDLKNEILQHDRIENPLVWFRETFDDSMRLRMVSDVPVGVLLSGGLDSSSVLASLHKQQYRDINAFTIGFRESEHNEAHLAEKLAGQLGYAFHSLFLEGDAVFENLVQSTYFHGEPIMHLSEPHLLAISKRAKPTVKVLLSGEGADELMGGYLRYKTLQYPGLLHALAFVGSLPGLAKSRRYDKLFRYAKIAGKRDQILFNGSNLYPDDIARTFGIKTAPKNEYRNTLYEEAVSLYPGDMRRQAMYFDQHTYLCSLLDRNDRCTMGASIECREPFLDPRLVAGLGTLDNDWFFAGKKGKFILKKAMEPRLPAAILNFRKIGLSAPWCNYLTNIPVFREELEAFRTSDIFHLPYLENINANALADQLRSGDPNVVSYLMPLFTLHIWLKYYVEKFSSFEKLRA